MLVDSFNGIWNVEFYEKGKEFFYSGLPKNLANFEHYKNKSYKNYKG